MEDARFMLAIENKAVTFRMTNFMNGNYRFNNNMRELVTAVGYIYEKLVRTILRVSILHEYIIESLPFLL